MKALVTRVQALSRSIRLLGRALALVGGIAPGATAIYTLIVALSSSLLILQVWLARRLVDTLLSGTGETALLLGTVYAVTLIVPPALEPINAVLNAWIEDRSTRAIDRRLMAAGEQMVDLGLIERPAFHNALNIAQASVYYAPNLLQIVGIVGGGSLTLTGVLLLLGQLHPLLPLALLLVALPHLLVETRYFQQTYEAMGVRSPAAREMEYFSRLATETEAAKEVRVFGLGAWLLTQFEERYRTGFREVTRLRLGYLRTAGAFAALHAIALAGGFAYVADRARTGDLSLGDLALYINAIIQAEALLGMLPGWVGLPYESVLYIRGLFEFLDRAVPTIAIASPEAARPAPAQLEQGIELRNVAFTYPDSPTAVFDDVSLTLRPGRITALVGHNGAGKSTLVKLLTRMYDPSHGTILLDGKPLQAYDLPSLRAQLAVVYQDFAHFALSLRDNIEVGAVSSPSTIDLEAAAQRAGADDVAKMLPQGYDTELTKQFEGGVEISGGQWQKVALARGFVRNTALVILDEPTSALDAEAEYRLFEQWRELMQGRTTLIISHRFSTVRMADTIVVVENGRVVEQGTHSELIEQGGRYAELFEMQAGRYR